VLVYRMLTHGEAWVDRGAARERHPPRDANKSFWRALPSCNRIKAIRANLRSRSAKCIFKSWRYAVALTVFLMATQGTETGWLSTRWGMS
jgi:hypothetical protein